MGGSSADTPNRKLPTTRELARASNRPTAIPRGVLAGAWSVSEDRFEVQELEVIVRDPGGGYALGLASVMRESQESGGVAGDVFKSLSGRGAVILQVGERDGVECAVGCAVGRKYDQMFGGSDG